MAVGGLFPARGEVPVVGDVVVVEDHQRRHAGQGPRRLRQGRDEALDAARLGGVALTVLGVERRWHHLDQRPGRRRPAEQIERQHLAQGHQVIVGIGGGEDGFLHPAEEFLAQRPVGLEGRQQVLAVVEVGGMGHQRLAVRHYRPFEVLAIEPEAADQRLHRQQHRSGDVIGIDLVAREQQRRRRLLRDRAALQQAIHGDHAIGRGMVGLAAGAVQQMIETCAQDEARQFALGGEQVRRPVADSAGAQLQVVAEEGVRGQLGVRPDLDQLQIGLLAQAQALGLPLHAELGRPLPQPRHGRLGRVGHQPQQQPGRFGAPQQRAGQHRGQGRGSAHGVSCSHATDHYAVPGFRLQPPPGYKV